MKFTKENFVKRAKEVFTAFQISKLTSEMADGLDYDLLDAIMELEETFDIYISDSAVDEGCDKEMDIDSFIELLYKDIVVQADE